MQITYFGHSAFQIRTGKTTILIDPFISGNPHADGVVSLDDLSPDVILLTHAHGDHWGDTPDIARRTGALVVGNFEIAMYISREHGHENIHPMNTGGASTFDWGRVEMTYARHSSSFPDGTYGGNPNGYILEIEGRCLYLMGDTGPFAEMEWFRERYDIDVAFMPIGDCFTMGPRESAGVCRMIDPGLVVPTHYNTFPAIQVDLEAWKGMMNDSGFPTRVMEPGDTMELSPA